MLLETGGPNIEQWSHSAIARTLVGRMRVCTYPDNTERLDVVGGFENLFASDPPKVGVPVLLITPIPGEATAEDESFWLRISARSRQIEVGCDRGGHGGPCVDAILDFVETLR